MHNMSKNKQTDQQAINQQTSQQMSVKQKIPQKKKTATILQISYY